MRFRGLGWHVEHVDDANDTAALARALTAFKAEADKPTLVIVKSVIGYGAPTKAGSHSSHGAPLGADEIRGAKETYGWSPDASFVVPAEVPQRFTETLGTRGHACRDAWQTALAEHGQSHPELAKELREFLAGTLPAGWEQAIPDFPADTTGLASRVSSGQVLSAISPKVPWLVGGSADLAPSTMTFVKGEGNFGPADYAGRNFHFGIREHGMALCGLRPYVATFFVFFDYLKPSLRLSTLGDLGVIYILTHDSIGLGEDGPTHQPIEQLASARAVPGLSVYRPADANEVAETWRTVMQEPSRPVVIVLSRQGLPTLDRSTLGAASGTSRGAYILQEAEGGEPECILIGTGSEVGLCLAAAAQLAGEGVRARVVSMPSWDRFAAQDAAYREAVLPKKITARVACEAGCSFGWERWIGRCGRFIGMNSFGASGPAGELYKHFGITSEGIAQAAKDALGR